MDETNAIIGAGQAGGWAAIAMREAGFAGRIVLIGEEEHLPYERPPLSKSVLLADEVAGPSFFHPATRYQELGIDCALGAPVEAVDPTARSVILADGRRIGFSALLLATGGAPRRLSVPGNEHVRYLRTYEDALVLRGALRGARKVACIGAGVIGLELAASARSMGCDVSVFEAGPSIMGRSLSPEGVAFMTRIHERAGVALHCGVLVRAIEQTPAGLAVHLSNGSADEFDIVVAGIGMERSTGLARAMGARCEDGVLVDQFGRTNIADVYAAGDAAAFWSVSRGAYRRLENWRHAQNHGRSVGRNMVCGRPEPYEDVPSFWTQQFAIHLQVVGLPFEASSTVLRPTEADGGFCAFHLGGDGALVALTAANEPRAAKVGHMLIQSGRKPDVDMLADPAVPFQKLAALYR